MSSTWGKIKECLALEKKAREIQADADNIMRSGPRDYYMERLEGYVEALFDKYAPFKEGDRVEIYRVPNTDNGWSSCKHFLIKGAEGVCSDVDYRDGNWCADVVFDNETYIDMNGKPQPVSSKHTFCMWETQIRKVT